MKKYETHEKNFHFESLICFNRAKYLIYNSLLKAK